MARMFISLVIVMFLAVAMPAYAQDSGIQGDGDSSGGCCAAESGPAPPYTIHFKYFKSVGDCDMLLEFSTPGVAHGAVSLSLDLMIKEYDRVGVWQLDGREKIYTCVRGRLHETEAVPPQSR